MLEPLRGFFGLCVFVALAWVLGENRRAARAKVAAAGILVQIALAFLVLKVPPVRDAFSAMNRLVETMQAASEAGSSVVFGYLGGGPLPFEVTQPGATFVLAYRALPLIIVVSALTALFTYWRILPVVVRGFSFVLRKTFGVSGAVGLGAAANIFVGMVEGPMFVRPFLGTMTRSELFVQMTAGMASIAGTVLVLYATLLAGVVPDAAGHLLAASIMSAPAAITIALLMVPETQPGRTEELHIDRGAASAMDAITSGTESGLKIYLMVIATLIVLGALVHLGNSSIGVLPDVAGRPLSLERMLGWLMAPVVWLMGIPWSESATAGSLMGTKTVLNELLAYIQMSQLAPDALTDRSRLIMTYALCGFANFGSLGIMLGGLSAMVPERRAEIVALGGRSIIAGTLATCSTGAVVGMLS